jgi:heat shock protein HtpX
MGRLALSRRREFLADAGAVELTKNPDALVSALRKIDGRSEIAGSPSSVMEMAIASGEGQFADLFSTHPSLEKRIDALQRFAGASRDVLKVETPIAISRAPPSRAEVPHNAAGGSPRTFLRRVKPPP